MSHSRMFNSYRDTAGRVNTIEFLLVILHVGILENKEGACYFHFFESAKWVNESTLFPAHLMIAVFNYNVLKNTTQHAIFTFAFHIYLWFWSQLNMLTHQLNG